MDPNLILASKILDHLIEGTTIEPTGHMNSRRIHTFGDLAKAMNKLGLVPKSGEWSGDSIKQFFARLRRRYGAGKLKSICRYEEIGQPWTQFALGDTVSRGRGYRDPRYSQAQRDTKDGAFADLQRRNCAKYINEWAKAHVSSMSRRGTRDRMLDEAFEKMSKKLSRFPRRVA